MIADRLRARIGSEGPIPVRDFMQFVLHDPDGGYYAKGRDIGARGDFYTSANVSLFAGAVARFTKAALERLGPGARVVELGGGTGALAHALDTPLTLVEPNAGMARQQRARGLHVVASLDELEPAATVFVANEVLDALAVHRIKMTEEGLREMYVTENGEGFVEVPGPLTRPELLDAAKRLAEWLEPGCAAEVNLDAAPLFHAMARAGPTSLALFIDYGGEPQELYGPTRPQGSLRGYHEHRATRPYERPGDQDVTADVDFPFIKQLANREGFTQAGYRQQGEMLADLGLAEDMMAALSRGDTAAYLAGKNLLMPGGMGERFKALLLARNVETDPALPGFRKLSLGFPGGR